MAMSNTSKGCLGLLGLSIILVVAMVGIGRLVTWGQQRLGPRSTPVPTMTPEQVAQDAQRVRDAAWRKEKLREVIARQEAEAARERDAEEAAWMRTPAGRVWREHQDWSRGDCWLIATRQVRLGFSEDQCRAAWGPPDNTRRSVDPGHTTTLLCYAEFCRRALYLLDGQLVRIEQ